MNRDRGMNRSRRIGRSRSIRGGLISRGRNVRGGGSLVLDIGDISGVSVDGVGHDLETAVGEADLVGTVGIVPEIGI